jgi:hypothetical protein
LTAADEKGHSGLDSKILYVTTPGEKKIKEGMEEELKEKREEEEKPGLEEKETRLGEEKKKKS